MTRRFCTSCGNELPEAARFCGECGAKVEAGTKPAAETTAPSAPPNSPVPTAETVEEQESEPDAALPALPPEDVKKPGWIRDHVVLLSIIGAAAFAGLVGAMLTFTGGGASESAAYSAGKAASQPLKSEPLLSSRDQDIRNGFAYMGCNVVLQASTFRGSPSGQQNDFRRGCLEALGIKNVRREQEQAASEDAAREPIRAQAVRDWPDQYKAGRTYCANDTDPLSLKPLDGPQQTGQQATSPQALAWTLGCTDVIGGKPDRTATTSSPGTTTEPASTIQEPDGAPEAGFKVPSGDITCFTGESVAGPFLNCRVSPGFPPFPDTPDDCDLALGYVVGMVDAGQPQVTCPRASDPNPDYATLAYGKAWKTQGFICVSQRRGLACAAREVPEGFFLGRSGSKFTNGSIPALVSPKTSKAAAGPVFIATGIFDFDKFVSRPTDINLAMGARWFLTNLVWSTWGGERATARGMENGSTPVAVVAFDKQSCADGLVAYRRLRITEDGKPPVETSQFCR